MPKCANAGSGKQAGSACVCLFAFLLACLSVCLYILVCVYPSICVSVLRCARCSSGVSTSLMCDRTESSCVMQAEADSVDLGRYEGVEQVQASLQVGAKARQVIMEGVLQLQVPFDTSTTCSVVAICALAAHKIALVKALAAHKIAVVTAPARVKHKHTPFSYPSCQTDHRCTALVCCATQTACQTEHKHACLSVLSAAASWCDHILFIMAKSLGHVFHKYLQVAWFVYVYFWSPRQGPEMAVLFSNCVSRSLRCIPRLQMLPGRAQEARLP